MGIQKFIFFSIHNCDKHPEVPLMEIKFCTEKFLRDLGLNHVIIRLCGFMQVQSIIVHSLAVCFTYILDNSFVTIPCSEFFFFLFQFFINGWTSSDLSHGMDYGKRKWFSPLMSSKEVEYFNVQQILQHFVFLKCPGKKLSFMFLSDCLIVLLHS